MQIFAKKVSLISRHQNIHIKRPLYMHQFFFKSTILSTKSSNITLLIGIYTIRIEINTLTSITHEREHCRAISLISQRSCRI